MKLKNKIYEQGNRIILNAFRNSTYEYYCSQLKTLENPDIFESEDLALHFGHQVMTEVAFQYVVGGLIIDRIKFIDECLADQNIKTRTFLDVGDSDGIFLKSLNKTGISANISETVVKIQTTKGYITVRCDAEHLPFRSGSVDHILFFQIFEHLKNPISTLEELRRIARKSIFISIPSMTKTNIHKYLYNPDWPWYEHHIFEFNDEDFRKIITHAGFSVERSKVVSVFCPNKMIIKLFLYLFSIFIPLIRIDEEYKNNKSDVLFGCFRNFGLYHLMKSDSTD